MTGPGKGFALGPHLRPHVPGIRLHPRSPKAGFLNLASNELVHPTVSALLAEALARLEADAARMYPHQPDLVDALARHHGLDPAQVLVSAGSDDALKTVAEALFATSGRLVRLEPDYDQTYAELRGIATVSLRFGEHRPRAFTLDQFDRALSSTPPCSVLLSNPNAPTGFAFTADQMQELAARCHRNGHLLVVDEAYVAFCGFDHVGLLRSFDNVVLVRSLSKSYGIAGLRAALVAASPPVAHYLARWNTMNPVSGVTVEVVRYALSREDVYREVWREIVEARAWFAARVSARFPDWTALPSSGNFVNFETDRPATADAVTRFLAARKILVKSMTSVPGLAACFRVTVGDRATMEQVVAALDDFRP